MKAIAKVLSFILFAALIYLLLFFINVNIYIKKYPLLLSSSDIYSPKGGATYQTFQDYEKNRESNVIIIGSSHAYRGYDPRNFKARGIEAFNLGTSAQSIANTYYLTKNYIDSSTCKLLILDVYEGTLMSDGFESSSNLIENVTSDKAALDIAWDAKDIRMINIMIYRFFSRNHPPAYLDSTYIGRGYCEITDSVKPGFKFPRYTFVAYPKKIDYFKKTLEFLNENKISFVVVNHPMPSEGGYTNHQDFANVLEPIVNKFGGVFIDFALDRTFDARNHFYDHTHLNKAGVQLFNDKLIDTLLMRNILPGSI